MLLALHNMAVMDGGRRGHNCIIGNCRSNYTTCIIGLFLSIVRAVLSIVRDVLCNVRDPHNCVFRDCRSSGLLRRCNCWRRSRRNGNS